MEIKAKTDFLGAYLKQGSSLLDMGCGEGHLLQELSMRYSIKGYGIEIDQNMIHQCQANAVNVIQYDLNKRLDFLPDNEFDLVILSDFLQFVEDPLAVVSEATRVGKKVAIFFSNSGYIMHRLKFLLSGRFHDQKSISQWQKSKNTRPFSMIDFFQLCESENYHIEHYKTTSKLGTICENLMAKSVSLIIRAP